MKRLLPFLMLLALSSIGMAQDGGTDAGVGADAGSKEPVTTDESKTPLQELTGAHRPKLIVSVPKGEVFTGDLVKVELRADAKRGDELAIPEQKFGPFEIIDTRTSKSDKGDRTEHIFEIDVLALSPGQHALPPITIRVLTNEGVVGKVQTQPQPIRVRSVLGNEPNAEPKPATKPIAVLQKDDTLWWILGALGLMLITALLTWLMARWWRKREIAQAPPPPPRPAWELALEQLRKHKSQRLHSFETGEDTQWVDGVSDTMREYFGGRYGFDGLESTSDEIIAALRNRKMVPEQLAEITSLLAECDLVKFAKVTMDEEGGERLIQEAFRLVQQTSPLNNTVTKPVVAVATSAIPELVAPTPAESADTKWMPRETASDSDTSDGSFRASSRVLPHSPPNGTTGTLSSVAPGAAQADIENPPSEHSSLNSDTDTDTDSGTDTDTDTDSGTDTDTDTDADSDDPRRES